MANKQQLEFLIRPDGSIEERVTGIPGDSCEAVTEAIERALGVVVDRQNTSDFYSAAQDVEETAKVQP